MGGPCPVPAHAQPGQADKNPCENIEYDYREGAGGAAFLNWRGVSIVAAVGDAQYGRMAAQRSNPELTRIARHAPSSAPERLAPSAKRQRGWVDPSLTLRD